MFSSEAHNFCNKSGPDVDARKALSSSVVALPAQEVLLSEILTGNTGSSQEIFALPSHTLG